MYIAAALTKTTSFLYIPQVIAMFGSHTQKLAVTKNHSVGGIVFQGPSFKNTTEEN